MPSSKKCYNMNFDKQASLIDIYMVNFHTILSYQKYHFKYRLLWEAKMLMLQVAV